MQVGGWVQSRTTSAATFCNTESVFPKVGSYQLYLEGIPLVLLGGSPIPPVAMSISSRDFCDIATEESLGQPRFWPLGPQVGDSDVETEVDSSIATILGRYVIAIVFVVAQVLATDPPRSYQFH
jgi:hypothetical protein